MKKVVSVFILTCIFIGSFYAQSENSNISTNVSFVQAGHSGSGDGTCNKYLVFTEVSSESEDNESKVTISFNDVIVKYNSVSFNINQSNCLLNENVHAYVNLISVPLFLRNRRMLI